jgi:hypothetical protein
MSAVPSNPLGREATMTPSRDAVWPFRAKVEDFMDVKYSDAAPAQWPSAPSNWAEAEHSEFLTFLNAV